MSNIVLRCLYFVLLAALGLLLLPVWLLALLVVRLRDDPHGTTAHY